MDGGSVISEEDASSFFISNYPKHKEYIRLLMYYFIKIYLFIHVRKKGVKGNS